MRVAFLVSLSFILSFCKGRAQGPSLQNFSVNQGLAQSTVNDFIFDGDGVVWVTTGDGLDRLDSKNIVHYSHSNFKPRGLASIAVRDLLHDTTRHRIWVGSDNGVFFYDYYIGQFMHPFEGHEMIMSKYAVPLSIHENVLIIWVGGTGLFTVQLESNSISMLYEDSGISSVEVDDSGEWIYLHSNKGQFVRIHLFDGVSSQIPISSALVGESIHSIDLSEHIAVANTSAGRYRLDFETISATLFGQPRNINASFTDSKDRLYLACHGEGVFVFDNNGTLLHAFTGEYDNSGSSFNLRMGRSFREDENGIIWMSTDGQGLVLINHSPEKFQSLKVRGGDVEIPFKRFIRAMDMEGDALRVGTYGDGGCILKGGEIIQKIEPDVVQKANHAITCFYDDAICDLMGTSTGLYRLQPDGQLSGRLSESAEIYFKQLVQTQRYGLIAATKSGIYEIDSMRWSVRRRDDILFYQNIGRMHQDALGNLWVGANGEGLFLITQRERINIDLRGYFSNVLPPNIVFHTFHETHDFLWCGTNYGLIKCQKEGAIIDVISDLNGLANSCIYGVQEDDRGNLWLSSNKGISAFNPFSKRVRNFSVSDGIGNMEFNSGVFAKDGLGNFYFGGIDGITVFRPNDFFNQRGPQKLFLSSVSVSGIEVTNLDSLKHLKQPYLLATNHGNIGFEIVAIDFVSSAPHPIQYQLLGADDDFLLAGKDDFIRYTDLPPGSYQLVARSMNLDNTWSKPVVLFSFAVETPIWQRMWFVILSVIILLGLVYGILFFLANRRNRLALLEIKRRDEIERVRMRIARDIHDEVGAGLTRISLLSEAARIDQNRGKNVQDSLIKLATTARDLGSGLYEIIWSVNPDFDTVESLVEHSRQFVFTFLEDSPLEIDFQVEISHPQQMLTPDQRRNLYLILKEAVHNVIRHASATTITIVFIVDKDQLFKMVLMDDGVGISDSLEYVDHGFSGNGVRNMSSRAKAIQFAFQIIGMDKGTSVSVEGKLE